MKDLFNAQSAVEHSGTQSKRFPAAFANFRALGFLCIERFALWAI
jgi:hypothetical protein